jgi:hypothetical protein
MALLTDPDSLSQGTEIVIAETATPPTVQLLAAGNLSSDGVTGQCVYAFLKEEWLGAATLPPYPFPLDAVTPEQMIWIDDWEPADDTTRKLIRTCGWTEQEADGTIKREYCCVISVPPAGVEATDQPYYEHAAGTPVDFARAGQVNEAIQIYGDTTHGNFNRRATDITVFAREEQKTYASASVFTTYSITSLGTGAYRVGLQTAADTKATVADTGIDANSDGTADVDPYDAMVLQEHASTQSIAMAGGSYNFKWTLDCNGARVQRAYEYAQWLLRQDADIDAGAGTQNGKVCPAIVSYVGDTLYTAQPQANEGLALTNFSAQDINAVVFTDDTGAQRTFPYTASLTILFGANLVSDAAAHYWVYPTDDFGGAGCVPVVDASDADMEGDVDGNTSITHTYDWTTGGDVDITVVALGTSGAKYVRTTGSIVQSTANQVSLAAGEERVYSNPA